jgi:formate hydrogenlyase transcriptional activator
MEQAIGRFRTLLEISNAISNQPSLQAVLQRLHQLLSAISRCDSAAIFLLTGRGETMRLGALERGTGISGPSIELGIEAPYAGTAAGRAVEEQRPIYVPDIQQEFANAPEPPAHSATTLRSGYMFPLSTPRRRIGVLCLASQKQGEFPSEDLALMSSVAALVASALETAMATDMADSYQKQLLEERDRWKLLLEINNLLVSHLNITDLFRAASVSLRKYFANDFAGIWLLNKEKNRMECSILEFPESRGAADISVPAVSSDELNRIRSHKAELWTRADFGRFEPTVTKMLVSEGIESLALVPLSTPNGPLGAIAIGSRRPGHFGSDDLDLLSQISTQISLSLDNALAYGKLNESRDKLEEERLYLESELRSEYNFEDIVGKSRALREVLKQIAIVAPTDSTVLLHGETGTGKELVARAIHSLSTRKTRTFVRLNCAAIPSGLVESELFGHEKGAFTGALMQKKGRFEIADHGTLFLDEIGDIPLDLQPKLLRALQEREFERLGSTRTLHVDVRVVAATHRDLPEMIRENKFREDLFYRLNVFPIEIPPLRDRREDIPLLVHYFVSRLTRRMQKNIRTIPKASMEALVQAPWHGNIRELENFIERAVILSPGEDLKLPAFELKTSAPRSSSSSSSPAAAQTFEESERQAIVDALKAASGRVSGPGGAAERLGLKRTTLQNKMRKLGITRSFN